MRGHLGRKRFHDDFLLPAILGRVLHLHHEMKLARCATLLSGFKKGLLHCHWLIRTLER